MRSNQFKNIFDLERYARLGYKQLDDVEIADYVEVSDERLPKLPDVSILVVTYNHEKWIKRCLDSILAQKTRYSYEIILSEDCSCDSTRVICIEYQRQHPDKIKLLLSNRNCGAAVNARRVRCVACGRYISWCEGDDYWIFDGKIETQVGFLDANPSIMFHAANKRMVYLDREEVEDVTDVTGCGKPMLYRLEDNGPGKYAFCHISTWCMRKKLLDELNDLTLKIGYSRDELMLFLIEGLYGAYIVPEVYSVHVVTGSGIWSSMSIYGIYANILKGRLRNVKSKCFPKRLKRFALRALSEIYKTIGIFFFRRRQVISAIWAVSQAVRYKILAIVESFFTRFVCSKTADLLTD